MKKKKKRIDTQHEDINGNSVSESCRKIAKIRQRGKMVNVTNKNLWGEVLILYFLDRDESAPSCTIFFHRIDSDLYNLPE